MAAAASHTERFDAADMASGISQCAIAVTPGAYLTLEPILATASDIEGHYQFDVTAISNGGRSISRQANRFQDGKFAAPRMNFNADARIEALFEVTDPSGGILCSVEIHYPSSDTAGNGYGRLGGIHG